MSDTPSTVLAGTVGGLVSDVRGLLHRENDFVAQVVALRVGMSEIRDMLANERVKNAEEHGSLMVKVGTLTTKVDSLQGSVDALWDHLNEIKHRLDASTAALERARPGSTKAERIMTRAVTAVATAIVIWIGWLLKSQKP